MANKGALINQSVGGVKLPPRKVFKPAKTLVLRFSIVGTIPSKKNRQVADKNTKRLIGIFNSFLQDHSGKPVSPGLIRGLQKQVLEVKPYIRHSKGFEEWEAKTRTSLAEQASKWKESYAKDGLIFPITKCSISIYHYWKDRIVRDNSNKQETINDMLVSAGIIASDGAHCRRSGKDEAEVYKDEIWEHYTLITLCAYAW